MIRGLSFINCVKKAIEGAHRIQCFGCWKYLRSKASPKIWSITGCNEYVPKYQSYYFRGQLSLLWFRTPFLTLLVQKGSQTNLSCQIWSRKVSYFSCRLQFRHFTPLIDHYRSNFLGRNKFMQIADVNFIHIRTKKKSTILKLQTINQLKRCEKYPRIHNDQDHT